MRLIRNICIAFGAIILLFVAYILFVIYQALPAWKSVSRDDKIWTSEVYSEQFLNRERWPHIASFHCATFIEQDAIRPEFSDNSGLFSAEVFRILWHSRNNMDSRYHLMTNFRIVTNLILDKVYPPSADEVPVLGTVGGSDAIQAEVVHINTTQMVLTISTRGNGYMGGLEVNEVRTEKDGKIIDIKYIWHSAYKPRWWKVQWFAIYLQVIGRKVWLETVVAGVATPREGVLGAYHVEL